MGQIIERLTFYPLIIHVCIMYNIMYMYEDCSLSRRTDTYISRLQMEPFKRKAIDSDIAPRLLASQPVQLILHTHL